METAELPEPCEAICDQLLAYAPTRPVKADMRAVIIDDSGTVEEWEGEEQALSQDSGEERKAPFPSDPKANRHDKHDDEEPNVLPFIPGSAQPSPVVAVDCGMIRLGETEAGPIIALRAAVVIDRAAGTEVRLLRTGPLFLSNAHKLEILYALGGSQGQDDFFVTIGGRPPRPLAVKRGVADTGKYYGDRFRSWWERVAQNIAVQAVDNGIILFDGALTLRSRDTPDTNIKRLARTAGARGSSIVAIAKQSELAVQGRSVRWWLDDAPNLACCRDLTPLLRHEDGNREQRVLGNIFAARFSPHGPTFRTDVKVAPGATNEEALHQMFASVQIRSGYPDILVRAHAYSFFAWGDVIQLQAQACSMFHLTPQPEVRLTTAFGPFAGRFK